MMLGQNRFGGHCASMYERRKHPAARVRMSRVGSSKDIKQRIEQGRTLEQVARDIGSSLDCVQRTLELDGEAERLVHRATGMQVVAKSKEIGRPRVWDVQYILKVLDDVGGNVPLASQITGMSERRIFELKAEREQQRKQKVNARTGRFDDEPVLLRE